MSALHVIVRVAVLALLAPANARAQGPVQSAELVTAALGELRTSNGDIVEVVARLGCATAGCTDARADSALARFAADRGASLVDGEIPDPLCRGEERIGPGRKGLRLRVRSIGSPEVGGPVRVFVETRCARPSSPMRLFVHVVEMPFALVNGEWRRQPGGITAIN